MDLAFTFVFLLAFQALLSGPVASMAYGASSNFYVSCLVYGSVFLAFMYLVSLPLDFITSFVVEHRFGLSRQDLASWARDEAKSSVLSFALSILCILVFYLVLRNFPRTWWIIAALAWIFFSVILARLFPVLVIPLFYKYSPVEDARLKEKIMSLAGKTGITLTDVCQIDFSRKTRKANAALTGLGRTCKVILADTLTSEFTPDEAEVVVAHELAHFKYRHIWKLLAFSGVMTVAGLFALYLVAGKIVALTGARAIYDLFLLPVLVLLMAFFGVVLLPAQNFFSRVLEKQADRFALDVTGRPADFIAVMRKLAEMNLADVSPSAIKKIFLYNHPPISERINMAVEWEKTRR